MIENNAKLILLLLAYLKLLIGVLMKLDVSAKQNVSIQELLYIVCSVFHFARAEYHMWLEYVPIAPKHL